MSFGVDDRRAGVTACDVVGGDEACRHASVFHGIASEVFVFIKFFQLGRYHEFRIVRVFFFHYSVEGGHVFVVYAVFRVVRLHVAIGEAQGEVCIGIRGQSFVCQSHFAYSAYVCLVRYGKFLVEFRHGEHHLAYLVPLGFGISVSQVFVKGFSCGLLQEFLQILFVAVYGVVIQLVYVFVIFAFEFFLYYAIEFRQVFFGYLLCIQGYEGFCHFSVYFMVIVFVEDVRVCGACQFLEFVGFFRVLVFGCCHDGVEQ